MTQRGSLVLMLVVLFTSVQVEAYLIDDFTVIDSPSPYPFTAEVGAFTYAILEESVPLGSFGTRATLILANPLTVPPPNPTDIGITASIDPAVGEWSAFTTVDARLDVVLAWTTNNLDVPADFDATEYGSLRISYESSSDMTLRINLANNLPGRGAPIVGNSEGVFPVPMATDGVLTVSLSEISRQVRDFSADPINPVFWPLADLASLDTISMAFSSGDAGASLRISRVEFVPESSSLCFAVLASLTARRPRATLTGRPRY